jgi:hypothetical protein
LNSNNKVYRTFEFKTVFKLTIWKTKKRKNRNKRKGEALPVQMQQPTSTAEGAQCSPPSAAQPRQSSPTHVTIRIKKKKSTFFFFPENDTAEECPGHVSDDDKLDPDVAKPSKTSPLRIRVRAHPKRAKIHAPIPCQRRRVSEPTTTVVPSFPTIPRSIKPPGGPP